MPCRGLRFALCARKRPIGAKPAFLKVSIRHYSTQHNQADMGRAIGARLRLDRDFSPYVQQRRLS